MSKRRGWPKGRKRAEEESNPITIRLPISVIDRLSIEAIRRGVSLSKVARERILCSVREAEPKPLAQNIH